MVTHIATSSLLHWKYCTHRYIAPSIHEEFFVLIKELQLCKKYVLRQYEEGRIRLLPKSINSLDQLSWWFLGQNVKIYQKILIYSEYFFFKKIHTVIPYFANQPCYNGTIGIWFIILMSLLFHEFGKEVEDIFFWCFRNKK